MSYVFLHLIPAYLLFVSLFAWILYVRISHVRATAENMLGLLILRCAEKAHLVNILFCASVPTTINKLENAFSECSDSLLQCCDWRSSWRSMNCRKSSRQRQHAMLFKLHWVSCIHTVQRIWSLCTVTWSKYLGCTWTVCADSCRCGLNYKFSSHRPWWLGRCRKYNLWSTGEIEYRSIEG